MAALFSRSNLHKVLAMLGLELRKTFLRPRALPVVIVAFLPAFLLGLRVVGQMVSGDPDHQGAAEIARVYGQIFQLFFVRLVIFFGCFGIFTYLARGEMAERSLHFYLLAPMRREVYLAGKYFAGLVAGSILFTVSLILQLLLAFLPAVTPGGYDYLFSGPGLGHAFAYWGVTLLAVVGYGALFLTLGLLLKNPMIPAAVLLGWEWMNFLLPAGLKQLSVIHHLQSLCPFPADKGPFALPAEPTPAWLAIPGLLAVAALLLWIAARRARRLEVAYAAE
jgi:hypothetical protein